LSDPFDTPNARDEVATYASAEELAFDRLPEEPVYCLRPHIIESQARRFQALFAGDILYAVKCNPHPLVLAALHRAGIRHFDTASLGEIEQISQAFEDGRSYFMHPVKSRAAILAAYDQHRVRHFVVDHSSELEKLREVLGVRDEVVILVRIATPPDAGTLYHLASKFGAEPDPATDLLRRASALGYRVGLSFHVGSQCLSPAAFEQALAIVGRVRDAAGVPLDCVDVGGGFPTRYPSLPNAMQVPALEDFMAAIARGLDALALDPRTDVFCEPGRAMVANGCSLLVQVQLRKDHRLYINDGIYGSLSEISLGTIHLPARLIRRGPPPSDRLMGFTLFGPTCDSLDVAPNTFALPADVREGDWIEIDQVGAYSNALASDFNGFRPDTFVIVRDTPGPGADAHSA